MSSKVNRRSSGILVALAICMAMQMTGFSMVLPLFARRFESFGAGVQALAVSDTVFALTGTITAPFIGMLADRFGRRPILLLSLAAYALIFGGYLLATSAWFLILARGLAGAFTAGLFPTMTSIVGDLSPENRRAQWYGIANGGAAAGYVAGPFLGGMLYDHYGYEMPFALPVLMAVGALLLAVFLIPETHTLVTHPGHHLLAWAQELQALPSRPTFLLLLLITFGVIFAWTFIGPQFMFYAYDELSWSSTRLGLVMSAYAFTFMLGEFVLGQLSDRIGRKPVLVLGLVLFLAQFIGLVVFRDLTWILVSFILAGLGNALYDPALTALILDITPADHTAGMTGLKATAGSLGNMLGPALVVLVTPFVGAQMVFLIATLMVSMLILISGFALHDRRGNTVTHPYSTSTIKP